MSSKPWKPEDGKTYRLITRSDMDGLVCAILFKSMGIIDDIMFAHPKDMQDSLIDVSENDISTNLPYVEGIGVAFDHHASETERVGDNVKNHIIDVEAPSAARVVYDYFGGDETFPDISMDMMEAVDKADSASFSKDDILNPHGWDLLSFIMDARTGLGRFRDFNISNYQLMMKLIDVCKDEQDINKILELPDVKERLEIYQSHEAKFKEQLERCTRVQENLAILDLRNEETIWAGNRFMIYALFPKINISMHIIWGKNKQNTVLAVGKSIINKTSNTHVGKLMLKYGGGGHEAAGTCQVKNLEADKTVEEIASKINSDG